MRFILTLCLAALLSPSLALGADLSQADDIFLAEPAPLEQFLWTNRPVVVFADTPNDPRFIEQMNRLTGRSEALAERDVVVMTDTDPAARGPLRQALRPRGFSLVLIAKDGQVTLRRPAPFDVRELTRVIDRMPLRQQEVRDRRAVGASTP